MIGELLLLALFDMFIVQILKKWVKSSTVIHLIVFVLAIVIGIGAWYWQYLPEATIQSIIAIWATAVGIYEILIKRIGGDVLSPLYLKVTGTPKKKKKKK